MIAQLVTIDYIGAAVAVAIAFLTRFGFANRSDKLGVDIVSAVLLPLAWVGIAKLNRAYDVRFVGVGTTEFGRMARTFVHLTALTAFVSYVAKLDMARGFVVLALPLALVFSWAGRYVARLRLHRLRRTGRAMNRVLAVGSAASVRTLSISMSRDLTAGLHVVGVCLPEREATDPLIRARMQDAGTPVMGTYDDVRNAALMSDARSVTVIAGDVGTKTLREISWQLEGGGADLIVSSGLEGVVAGRVQVQSVAGLPLLRVDEPVLGGFRQLLKSMFDRCAAALALIVLAPVMLVIAALVRCTSQGPALYLQTRYGRNGKPFRMVKFRSMRVGADAELHAIAEHNDVADGLLFKMREDPRITRIGRVLRRFSLDELPQLFNILNGSMSLVGPRPPLPAEVARYGHDVRRRLLVKPGLTGLWQVSGRSDLCWEESVNLDLHYVENWSFGLDVVVLLRTIRAVVSASGAY